MSGANTKDSKINRMLSRQFELDREFVKVFALLRDLYTKQATSKLMDDAIERLSNSLNLATETAARLEAENARLRKYLGSVLFERRQREAETNTRLTHLVPTLIDSLEILGPLINDIPLCSCPPGTCKGSVIGKNRCRHCVAPSDPRLKGVLGLPV